MKIFLIATLSILMSVAAQFSLKTGMSKTHLDSALLDIYSFKGLLAVFSNFYILGGFVLYGLGAVVWLGVLAKWDVSKAYPLVGLGFLITALIGILIGEDITLNRLAGIFMISLGVWLVAVN